MTSFLPTPPVWFHLHQWCSSPYIISLYLFLPIFAIYQSNSPEFSMSSYSLSSSISFQVSIIATLKKKSFLSPHLFCFHLSHVFSSSLSSCPYWTCISKHLLPRFYPSTCGTSRQSIIRSIPLCSVVFLLFLQRVSNTSSFSPLHPFSVYFVNSSLLLSKWLFLKLKTFLQTHKHLTLKSPAQKALIYLFMSLPVQW